MDFLDENSCLLALSSILQDKPEQANAIMSILGSASAYFDLNLFEKRSLFPKGSPIPFRSADKTVEKARKDFDLARENGISLIPQKSKLYPYLLKDCIDSPPCLLARGEPSFGSGFLPIVIYDEPENFRKSKGQMKGLVEHLLQSGIRPNVLYLCTPDDNLFRAMYLRSWGAYVTIIPETGLLTFLSSLKDKISRAFIDTAGVCLMSDHNLFGKRERFSDLRRCRIASGSAFATILFSSKDNSSGHRCAKLGNSYNRSIYVAPGDYTSPDFKASLELLANKKADIFQNPQQLGRELALLCKL